jgi:hypothetical protein
MPPTAEPEPRELDSEDFRVLLDERVRRALGISLQQFIEQLRAGELDPESPEIAGLAILVGARAD